MDSCSGRMEPCYCDPLCGAVYFGVVCLIWIRIHSPFCSGNACSQNNKGLVVEDKLKMKLCEVLETNMNLREGGREREVSLCPFPAPIDSFSVSAKNKVSRNKLPSRAIGTPCMGPNCWTLKSQGTRISCSVWCNGVVAKTVETRLRQKLQNANAIKGIQEQSVLVIFFFCISR